MKKDSPYKRSVLHTFCLPDGEDHAVAAKAQAEFAHYLCAAYTFM
nr:hypothetical protein [uncultured Anaerobutyricum sp.]